jgi:hypothetical protein
MHRNYHSVVNRTFLSKPLSNFLLTVRTVLALLFVLQIVRPGDVRSLHNGNSFTTNYTQIFAFMDPNIFTCSLVLKTPTFKVKGKLFCLRYLYRTKASDIIKCTGNPRYGPDDDELLQ